MGFGQATAPLLDPFAVYGEFKRLIVIGWVAKWKLLFVVDRMSPLELKSAVGSRVAPGPVPIAVRLKTWVVPDVYGRLLPS